MVIDDDGENMSIEVNFTRNFDSIDIPIGNVSNLTTIEYETALFKHGLISQDEGNYTIELIYPSPFDMEMMLALNIVAKRPPKPTTTQLPFSEIQQSATEGNKDTTAVTILRILMSIFTSVRDWEPWLLWVIVVLSIFVIIILVSVSVTFCFNQNKKQNRRGQYNAVPQRPDNESTATKSTNLQYYPRRVGNSAPVGKAMDPHGGAKSPAILQQDQIYDFTDSPVPTTTDTERDSSVYSRTQSSPQARPGYYC